MTNFMSDKGREFGITSHKCEQAGIDDHLGSRYRKRVRSEIDENGKLPLDVRPFDGGCNFPAHPSNFRVRCRITGDPAAALQLIECERALLRFRRGRQDQELPAPRFRHGRASSHRYKASAEAARRESLLPKVL